MRKIKKPLEAAAVAEAMRVTLAAVQAGAEAADVVATLRQHDERGQTDRLLQVLENVPAVNRLTGAEAETVDAAVALVKG